MGREGRANADTDGAEARASRAKTFDIGGSFGAFARDSGADVKIQQTTHTQNVHTRASPGRLSAVAQASAMVGAMPDVQCRCCRRLFRRLFLLLELVL